MSHIRACPRWAVSRLGDLIPGHWIRSLEQNQKIASCCRHPENHTIEAFYSSKNWKNKLDSVGGADPYGGVPDIYIFNCPCGRAHPRFMVGKGDIRPAWGLRQRVRAVFGSIIKWLRISTR